MKNGKQEGDTKHHTIMKEELSSLCFELQSVRKSTRDCFPEYGYMNRAEVCEMLREEIARMEDALAEEQYDCFDDELEQERRTLCLSQGLSRWC